MLPSRAPKCKVTVSYFLTDIFPKLIRELTDVVPFVFVTPFTITWAILHLKFNQTLKWSIHDLFKFFNTVDRKIKFVDDRIRTMILYSQKQPLYRQSPAKFKHFL